MDWHLTKEAAERVSNSHLLSLYNLDDELTAEDYEHLAWQITTFKDTLMQALPARFHPYIGDGSLNKPTLNHAVREDYFAWVQEEERYFRSLLDAAHRCSTEALAFCGKSIQDLFSQSLHDSEVWKIERTDGNVFVTIKCDCFTSIEVVVLIFDNVLYETLGESLQVGQHIVYDELKKTDGGFAYRIIDNNNVEWTIEAQTLNARNYYYPVAYGHLYNEGNLERTSIDQYIKQLNLHRHYTLVSQELEIPITRLHSQAPFLELATGELQVREDGLFAVIDNEQFRLGDDSDALISIIFTDVFEDPFEIQRTPLSEEEIEAAIFGDNPIGQVRAWHTLHENPQQFATIINTIFRKLTHTEDTHMMLYVYVNAFHKAAVLQDDIVEKFKDIIEPEE